MRKTIIYDGIDYEDGLRRCMGNESLYDSILLKFAAETDMSECEAAFHDKDYRAFLGFIHAMKGTSGNLGLNKLYEITSEIADIIKEGKHELLPNAYERFKNEFGIAAAAITDADNAD